MQKSSFFLVIILVSTIFTCCAPSANIIILNPDRWQEYRELRLSALKNDPESFAVSVEDEEILPESYWKEQLIEAQKGEDALLLFAQEQGKLVGMVGALREYKAVTYCRHLITITGMYVAPEMRGKNIGNSLLQTLLYALEKKNEPMVAMLWVTATKKAAIALYEKNGFTQCGMLPKSVRTQDRVFDSALMCRVIQ